jgi:hypothetical protein
MGARGSLDASVNRPKQLNSSFPEMPALDMHALLYRLSRGLAATRRGLTY